MILITEDFSTNLRVTADEINKRGLAAYVVTMCSGFRCLTEVVFRVPEDMVKDGKLIE